MHYYVDCNSAKFWSISMSLDKERIKYIMVYGIEYSSFANLFIHLTSIYWVLIRYHTQKRLIPRIINQLDLADIYRIIQSARAKCTFYSSSHGAFTKKDYILLHKIYINKLKRVKIMHSMFSDHSKIGNS